MPPEKSLAWWLDPDTKPPDLHERLARARAARAARPRRRAARARLRRRASTRPRGVDVTRVETFDDHLAATEVMWEAFDALPERREAQRNISAPEFEAARTPASP